MKLEFAEYKPKKIVNVHKHVDGPWFWGKYSAHPYIGCRSGCEFCYLRGSRYLGKRHPDSFDTLIQVKTNAIELLNKELNRLNVDVIAAGDWQQPAEDRYRLSRSMLESVYQHGFPLFIVERSPLLIRDLDLLIDINQALLLDQEAPDSNRADDVFRFHRVLAANGETITHHPGFP